MNHKRQQRILASKQFHNGRFRNTSGVGTAMSGNTAAIMADFFFGGRKRLPPGKIPVDNPLATWETEPATGLRITWFGHSTMLLESEGVRVLIDPMFADYASPVSFAGRKRFHPVPAKISELPPLDAIILSHDHYDHLANSSWKELAPLRVPVITSLGVGERLEKLGVDPSTITELDWWEKHTIAGGRMSITAAPAQHFSGRGLNDRNKTLWSSWVFSTASKRVFYSGDTGLTDELADIGNKLGPFDLVILEIGASNPAWAAIHLGPENALKAFRMLNGKTFFPVHWGTFDLALHTWSEPPETLLSLAEPQGVRVITPRVGQPAEPDSFDESIRWWRGMRD